VKSTVHLLQTARDYCALVPHSFIRAGSSSSTARNATAEAVPQDVFTFLRRNYTTAAAFKNMSAVAVGCSCHA
jgi:hypothetical protein